MRAPNATAPARSRTSSRGGRDTVPAHRRRRVVPGLYDRRCRRSTVVRGRVPPAAKPAAALPSRPLPDPDRGWTDGLRAFRFAGQCRPGVPFGAPFFILPAGGLDRLLQLGIGPLFARLPVGIDVLAKLAAGCDLLLGEGGLLGAQKSGSRLTSDRLSQAVIRTVARIGIIGAGTACLSALDRALGNRASPHGLWHGQFVSKLTDRRWDIGGSGHVSILRHNKP